MDEVPKPVEALIDVRVGMTGRVEEVVTRDLTVGAHVAGMPLVYATPMMIMLMEKASGAAIAGRLPPGGSRSAARSTSAISRPRPSAARSVATARVLEVEGRSVLFAVEAHDGVRKIGEGTHRRGAVNLERFAKRFGGG